MHRRGFLASLAALAIAPLCPRPNHTVGSFGAAPTVNGLALHPHAFAMVMSPLELEERYVRPAIKHLVDEDCRRMLAACGRA